METKGPASRAPKISVITVVRNGAATLPNAIESVLYQHDLAIELLVIDGCSIDGTVDIIKGYGGAIAYWTSEPDGGIYDAMNKGLAAARGEWVIFLGADDELKPVLSQLSEEMVDMAAVYYGDVEIARTGKVSGGKFTKYKLMQKNICHQAIFYPRSVYSAKKYDTTAGMLADHKYNIELWGSGIRFKRLNYVVSRFNDEGASGNAKARASFELLKLETIRSSFGNPFYTLKLIRNLAVRLMKQA